MDLSGKGHKIVKTRSRLESDSMLALLEIVIPIEWDKI
jgi:hypothetical protein